MTFPTYEFLRHSHESSRAGKLKLEFNQLARQHFGKEYSDVDLTYTGGKRVAPIFNKPWEIPIIDDSGITTDGNPGMLGVQVKNWEPGQSEPDDIYNKHLPSLSEAVEIVREHYSKIAKELKI